MYKIFAKNLEGFEKIFANDERLKLAEPLYLLRNIDTFNQHQQKNTKAYQNLLVIINEAKALKSELKYHNFGMFLTELDLQYFEFNTDTLTTSVNREILEYQISLLHQFMFPAYSSN